MPKFLLLDNSLFVLGGHHHEYAAHILSAARDLGLEPILACGTRLEETKAFPPGCAIHRVFPYESYGWHSQISIEPHRLRRRDAFARRWRSAPLAAIARELLDVRHWWRRLRRAPGRIVQQAAFARACRRLFSQVSLNPDDHVFLPTVSEFDLTCLSRYLHSAPKHVRQLQWHAQVHLPILEGDESEHADQQPRTRYVRQTLQAAFERMSGVDLRLYATTTGLQQQYASIAGREFTPLPYPVTAAIPREAPRPPAGGPLRILCAGSPRKEKGRDQLQQLVEALWTDYLKTGRVQLIVQAVDRGQLPTAPPPPAGIMPLIHAPFPLSREDYSALIQEADLGLLLYDRRPYYVRCSGVLLELLAVGRPVIVAGGCWLGEQVARANADYLSRRASDASPARRQKGSGPTQRFAVPPEAGAVVLRGPTDRERYAAPTWRWLQRDAQQNRLRSADAHAAYASLPRHHTVIALAATCTEFELRPFDSARSANSPTVDVGWLVGPRKPGGCVPSGAIGLETNGVADVVDSIEQMLHHAAHYRAEAQSFARGIREAHDPRQTVRILTDPQRARAAATDHKTYATKRRYAA